MKILLSEDDPLSLVLIREHLEKQGYTVVTTTNGWDALSHVENDDPFDLIISDIFMPEVSGLMMGNLVKQVFNTKTPLVLISGSDNDAIRKAVKEIGADAFFKKPIDIPEFLNCVESYRLKRRRGGN